MSDRYRYPPRARSPPLFNPGRMSLPSIVSNYAPTHEHHHVVPAGRREVIPGPRSSNSSVNTGGTITTTYKVKTDPPTRGSSVRERSRTRRSTLDDHNRPIVTTASRHRPVIHSGGVVRPDSPLRNPFRASEEEYVSVPATSRHGHHHTKRYSATMDNADMNRLARERESTGRLHVVPVREPAYTSSRARPVYAGAVTRHQDTATDNYGEDGYGYTNPRELVQYDLNNQQSSHHRSRRDSFGEGGRTSRPTSISGYGDIAPRPYDTRERGPPPTTRGFDKIRTPTWEQSQGRTSRPESPGLKQQLESVPRPAPFEPVQPVRRGSMTRARPQSMYQDRDNRRGQRDDSYEVQDDRRESRSSRHDGAVEQRGFGIRTERPERNERSERAERTERSDRPERSERSDRNDRDDRTDRSDRADRGERAERPRKNDRQDSDRSDEKEHKGRDAVATGLSLAGAALGINAVKNSIKADRDEPKEREDRDDRKKRDYDEEPRRRKDKDERQPVDLGGRDPKERRHRDEDVPPPPRDIPAPPRDMPSSRDAPPRDMPSSRDAPQREITPPQAGFIDLGGRDPKEKQLPREDREQDPERRRKHRHASEAALAGTAIESSESSASEETRPRHRRDPPARRESGTAPPAFNPKDTMDLFALKEALKSKDGGSKLAPLEAVSKPRTPRGSTTKDVREASAIRNDLNSERRPRDPLALHENRQLRVVSPPREKAEEKVVKGILRKPRETFPEDPAPIREGVAPLKDAKKDGIPPDARWTKISRKLVNPEALEAGKERFEARDDFVIVLRVLSRDDVQGYAEVTQRIRGLLPHLALRTSYH